MKKIVSKKIYRYAALGVALFALSAIAVVKISHRQAEAQAQTFPTPSYVIFLPAVDPNNGGVNGGKLDISGSGPFTENFRVKLCLEDAAGSAGLQCVWTPWAAAAAAAGTSQTTDAHNVPEYTAANATTWWSQWVGSPRSGPWEAPIGVSYITIQTSTLPAGQVINNVQLGIQFVEDNGAAPSAGPACLQAIGGGYLTLPDTNWQPGVMAHPDSAEFTPIGGGITPGYAYGWTNENCGDPSALSNTPNYFRIYMSADQYNAVGVSNNIPSTFTPSQSVSTGSDGNPVEITVKNTGNDPWTSDQSTVISGSQSGTCNGPGGSSPAASDPQGTSCTVSLNNYSSVFELQHISGSFTAGSDPAQYSITTQRVCTVAATGCSDSACSTQSACTSAGVCSKSGYGSLGQSCGANASACSSSGCNGTWTTGCNSTWGPQLQCSISGDPNVEPGASAIFKLNTLTAPASVGSYTENWQMTQKGLGNFGSVVPVSINVGSGATTTPTSTPSTGTVTITSENSQTGSQISSSWDAVTSDASGINDLCGTSSCTGESGTYNDIPTDDDTVTITAGSAPASYVLLGYCAYFGSSSAQCATPNPQNLGTNSLTLTSASPDANFVVFWAPEASMSITPGSVSISNTNPTATLTITNGSTAPGSELGWTQSITTSDGNGWLTISPAGPGTLGSGSSAPLTLTYSGTLAPGTYTASITFTGTSVDAGSVPPETQTIPVTLTVANSGGFSCVNNACTAVSSGGVSAASCTAACGESPSGGSGFACINNACTAVSSGGVSAASCSDACGTSGGGGGGGGASNYSCVNDACVLVASGGTTLPNCTAACDGGSGGTGTEYTCKNNACEAVTSGGVSAPDCEAACGAPPPPTCTSASCQASCNPSLTASPSSIVVPEVSNLTYSCSNVTECEVTGGTLPGSPIYPAGGSTDISGSITTMPSLTTTYTLTCVNDNYTNDSVSSNAQVTVSGSNLCEQNPNAAGCPGQ